MFSLRNLLIGAVIVVTAFAGLAFYEAKAEPAVFGPDLNFADTCKTPDEVKFMFLSLQPLGEVARVIEGADQDKLNGLWMSIGILSVDVRTDVFVDTGPKTQGYENGKDDSVYFFVTYVKEKDLVCATDTWWQTESFWNSIRENALGEKVTPPATEAPETPGTLTEDQ